MIAAFGSSGEFEAVQYRSLLERLCTSQAPGAGWRKDAVNYLFVQVRERIFGLEQCDVRTLREVEQILEVMRRLRQSCPSDTRYRKVVAFVALRVRPRYEDVSRRAGNARSTEFIDVAGRILMLVGEFAREIKEKPGKEGA